MFNFAEQINVGLSKHTRHIKVPQKEYERFCNEYIFDAIKGKRFGPAFCEKFKIVDYMLLLSKHSVERQKEYIRKAKYIK